MIGCPNHPFRSHLSGPIIRRRSWAIPLVKKISHRQYRHHLRSSLKRMMGLVRTGTKIPSRHRHLQRQHLRGMTQTFVPFSTLGLMFVIFWSWCTTSRRCNQPDPSILWLVRYSRSKMPNWQKLQLNWTTCSATGLLVNSDCAALSDLPQHSIASFHIPPTSFCHSVVLEYISRFCCCTIPLSPLATRAFYDASDEVERFDALALDRLILLLQWSRAAFR